MLSIPGLSSASASLVTGCLIHRSELGEIPLIFTGHLIHTTNNGFRTSTRGQTIGPKLQRHLSRSVTPPCTASHCKHVQSCTSQHITRYYYGLLNVLFFGAIVRDVLLLLLSCHVRCEFRCYCHSIPVSVYTKKKI